MYISLKRISNFCKGKFDILSLFIFYIWKHGNKYFHFLKVVYKSVTIQVFNFDFSKDFCSICFCKDQ